MTQFDVLKNPRGGAFPLVVDLQAELLSAMSTHVVAPLVAAKRYPGKRAMRLNPLTKVRGIEYIVLIQDLASIEVSELGDVVGSLAPQRAELIAALDLLFTGS